MSNPLDSMQPEESWEELRTPYQLGTGFCYQAKAPLLNGTYTRLFRSGDWTVGWVYFGREVTGPPGYAHGGAQACILDDIMGAAVWSQGYPSVAASLNFSFEAMGVKLETPLLVESYIEEKDDGSAKVWSGIRDENGVVATEGEAVFARLSVERLNTIFTEGGYPIGEFNEYVERHGLTL